MEFSIYKHHIIILNKQINKKKHFQMSTQAHTQAIPAGLSTEGAGKMSTFVSQFLPGRTITLYSFSYCLSFQLLINLHLGADWDSPKSLKELVSMSPTNSPSLTPTVKAHLQLLHGKSLSKHLTSQLLQLLPEGLVPNSPTYGR